MLRVSRLIVILIVLVTGASLVGASDARSAGYWIRWSSCRGVDAAEHGGTGPERVLLEDLLADPGIMWDDGQDDELVVRIGTCEPAMELAAELRRFNLGRGCSRPTDDVERGGS